MSMIAAIVNLLFSWIEGMITVFIPTRFLAKDISGQVVVITGGGSGIGRILAVKFADKGCTPVIWDLNQEGMRQTVDEVRRFTGRSCHYYACDVSDRKAVYETMARVKADVGPVNILVNNAGIVNGKRLMDMEDERMVKLMEVNTMSHFWTVKSVLQDMMDRNEGHIVSISSIAGLSGACNMTDYCASKHAAIGFMEALMFELNADGFTGVKTTTVCPWYINTGLFAGVDPGIVPFLEPEYVAESVVDAVLRNQAVLFMPKALYFLLVLKAMMPTKALIHLFKGLNGHKHMETFVGRTAVVSNNGNDPSIKSRVQ